MSPIVKKFLAAALIYLALGLLAQTVSVLDVWLGFNPLAYTAATATQQLFLLGWLTQLGMALVYDRWLQGLEIGDSGSIQNRKSKIENTQRALRPKSFLWVFILFNIGLPLVIAAQPGLALFGGAWLGPVAAIGALLQLIAGLLFVKQAWSALK